MAICIFYGVAFAMSQDEVDVIIEQDSVAFSEDLLMSIPEYSEWDVATISGKLKMKGLPLSPGIRIFMQKDSLIEISVKAPLMGEVGRIILNNNKVVGINKMNKSYSQSSIKDFLSLYPGGLSDIQSLLLGRIVVPGYGLMRNELADIMEIYEIEEGLALVPVDSASIEGIEYGYLIDEDFKPLLLLVTSESRPDVLFQVTYEYMPGGYDLSFTSVDGAKSLSIGLELNDPEWKGSPLSEIKLDKKYREMSIEDFIKNFGK